MRGTAEYMRMTITMVISEACARSAVLSLRGARVEVHDGQRALLCVHELDLFPGDRVVVSGPSGSGKSMLLATLAGRWAPGLTFTGHRVGSAERIGFVPQRGLDALHPLMPLTTQLRRVSGASPGRVAEVLNRVGLDDPALQRRRPASMSGGQAQRASVALAALTGARLILADEPTSALDHETRDQTLHLLGEIVDDTQALVISTHDPEVAMGLATRRLMVSEGEITEVAA